ncbi:MAG: replicative DNA helicase [Acidimicrobiia bacterium]|nr:replicative DNA helicase [Actinomycetota bacterium]MBL6924148.1 replicative DNA helicase [Acidimicrobiia bacterium]MBL6926902.1 replicative DNA helicase [Acidimicrobiia bacterium]
MPGYAPTTQSRRQTSSGGGRRPSIRVPPQNIEAEASLLGAMLLSRDAIADALEVVSAEHFYKPSHAHVFDAICGLYSAGEPVDPVTVAEALSRADLLASLGGTGLLLELQAATPATSSASKYARIIHEHATLRGLIGAANEIAEIGYSRPDDVIKAVDEAESLVFQVGQGRVTDSMAVIRELLDSNLDRLEILFEQGDNITGTETGYKDLDDLLSGLQENSLVIVGGRPAMGKTSFALGLAAHIGVESDLPVLLFSLEMSQLELSQRILCSEARVDSKHIRNGQLTHDDWSRINHGIGKLAEAPIWIDDNPNISVMEIRAKARRLKSRVGKLGVIVVDYIQLMTGRSTAESRQIEVSEISRGLKILARELETPVVGLSQLSRGLEARQDKRPMLADLRESGSIEQDADVVIFIYRDEVYNPESPDMGTAEVIVAKHRNGPTGTVRLAFLPHYTRFANMARLG